jgi:hypothetical protein
MMFHTSLCPSGRHHGSERFPGRSSHHEGNEASELGTTVGYVIYMQLKLFTVSSFISHGFKFPPQSR